MLTLYYSPGACSLAPHILLEELEMPYELVEVNVQAGKTKEPEFLLINPKARVPVLVIDNEVLTEVTAICWYIAASSPTGANLVPSDPLEQARVLEWFNWLSGTLHAVAFGGKWNPERFISDASRFDEVKMKADENLEAGFNHIESSLSKDGWAIRDHYSLADPFLFVYYNWARSIDRELVHKYPKWTAHAIRMVGRKAVQRALQQEGFK